MDGILKGNRTEMSLKMRDTIFYMRGPFPFGFDPGISPKMVGDAKAVLELSEGELRACGTALQEYEGFLDRETLQVVLSANLQKKQPAQQLARFIAAIDTRFRRLGEDVPGLIAKIRDWAKDQDGEDANILSNEDLDGLEHRLPVIIKQFPGLNRQAKAERLSKSTGLPLEDIQIICDLRPVFNEDRTVVEGVMPYTTLKIVCEGIDGLPLSLETVLSRKQVGDLLERVQEASKKLAVLEQILHDKEFRTPKTYLTMDKD